MAPPAAVARPSTQKGAWRPTKIMNMRDLSRDDDFLSHLLVEKLGTGEVPLIVHKMDPARRLPKQDPEELLQIVRRMVAMKGSPQVAIRQAVDDLLRLRAVTYYLETQEYDQKQVNAFATHASRYFELYLPGGSIEIAHTSRYSHRTGKSELCILATRPLNPGTVISELKGSMADLTEDEDKELKRTNGRHADGVAIRRDFSVIHSKQMKKNHLFLGPARFVNHDCDHNVELFREGRYITFRVIKMIGVGEEVTAHYGDGYFGENNCHCLCATCEKKGRGGYGPQDLQDDVSDSGTGSVQGGDSDRGDSDAEDGPNPENPNDSRSRGGTNMASPNKKKPGPIELAEALRDQGESSSTDLNRSTRGSSSSLDLSRPPHSTDATSILSTSSRSLGSLSRSRNHGLPTPEPEAEPRGRGMAKGRGRASSVLSNSASPNRAGSRSSTVVPFRPIISTRAQKAREASVSISTGTNAIEAALSTRSVSAVRQLVTPPLTSESTVPSASNSVRSSSRIRSRPLVPGAANASRLSTPVPDRKGKSRATESVSDLRDMDKDEPDVRHLRPRAPVPVYDQHGMSLKKPLDAPRGLDGKPLPTCVTCGCIIPVISVDSKVVWGLTLGRTGKRGRPKKNLQVECPRCMRHFHIYARKWPERISLDGTASFVPAPRLFGGAAYVPLPPKQVPESVLNGKHTTPNPSTVGRPPKRQLEDDADSMNSQKKQKVVEQPPRRRGRPPKNKVGMSDEAKEMLKPSLADGRRSNRPRVPSLKVREGDPTTKSRWSLRKNGSPCSPLTAEPESPIQSPDSPSVVSSVPSASPKSLAVASQPRETNGRFGKKESTNGRFMRKQFHVGARRYLTGYRPLNRGPLLTLNKSTEELAKDARDDVDDWQEESDDEHDQEQVSFASPKVEFGEEALEDMVLKRPRDSDDSDGYSPKRIRIQEDSEESDVSPQSSPRYHVGQGALLRPNPISFARRKWSGVDIGDDDLPAHFFHRSRHEEPEDNNPEQPSSDGARGDDTRSLMPAVDIVENTPSLRLTMRPSPMNLARRRWIPPPSSSLNSVRVPEACELDSTGTSGEVSIRKTVTVSLHSPVARNPAWSPNSDDSAEWYSDEEYSVEGSDGWSDEEEYLMADSIAFRRAMSMDVGDADFGDDHSEGVVERLLDARPATDSSSVSVSPPSPILSTPPHTFPSEKSPGQKWKQTVLIPVDATRRLSKPTTLVLAPIASSPRTLTQAGWDTASSDIES